MKKVWIEVSRNVGYNIGAVVASVINKLGTFDVESESRNRRVLFEVNTVAGVDVRFEVGF